VRGLPFLYLLTAEPAKCESDKDCFKGRARCIRKECHCTGHFVGDGKKKCDRKSVMSSNFHLLIQKNISIICTCYRKKMMSHLRHFGSKENRRALLLQEPQRIFYFFYFMVFEVIAWQWERTTLKATWFPGPLLLRPRGPSRRWHGNEFVLRFLMVWQVLWQV